MKAKADQKDKKKATLCYKANEIFCQIDYKLF